MLGMSVSAGEKHATKVFSLTTAQGRVNPLIPAQAANAGVPEEEEMQVCQNPSRISIPSQGKAMLSTLLCRRWLLWSRAEPGAHWFCSPSVPWVSPKLDLFAPPRNLCRNRLGL